MEHLAPPDYKAMFFGAVARHDALLDEIERLREALSAMTKDRDLFRNLFMGKSPGAADVANAAQEEK